jgi:hypothetical protein
MVDFPTLGLPTMATIPDITDRKGRVLIIENGELEI